MDENQLLYTIFAGILSHVDNDYKARRGMFLTAFPDIRIFRDEWYVLASLVKDHQELKLSQEFIANYLAANKLWLESSPYVNFGKFVSLDGTGDTYLVMMQAISILLDELEVYSFTNDSFAEALEAYRMLYINKSAVETLTDCVEIVTQGKKPLGSKKVLTGYTDMRSYLSNSLTVLDSLTNKTERLGLVAYGVNDFTDTLAEDKAVKLISTYGIPTLDKQVGGIYEGEMVSVLAPPKGGKSRFATYIIHNAIVSGVPILFWSIENGLAGFEALLRARHFDYFYNKDATSVSMRRWVDDDMIRKRNMSPELKELELASWTDLKANPKYGRIVSVDEDFNVENFLSVVDEAVKQYGVKLICLDYLQLIQGTGNTAKHERISDTYQKMLQYLKAKKIAGIFPGQIKQSAVSSLSKVDPADLVNEELRASAGESGEIIKTPDVNLCLYATVEELKQGRVTLLSIPSRNHRPFDPIPMNVALGSCTFYDASNISTVGSAT